MLSTRARPLVFPTLTPHQPHKPLKPLKPIISYSSSKASSSMAETKTQTVEHVVLFKVDPTATPSKISNMMTSLASLKTLPQVRHLSVGPILKTHSPFTHVLHSRYSSVHDLSSYSSHPLHLSAVRSSVLPISLDVLALDWLSPAPLPPIPLLRPPPLPLQAQGPRPARRHRPPLQRPRRLPGPPRPRPQLRRELLACQGPGFWDRIACRVWGRRGVGQARF
ncbi:hypothetical protein Syun_030838 [Stephania yunnanensis]|uniref:Stress-response A/B barrel domain-containing protein n=1 Tax=Stephania yunnanensis TaxID=152371 RepID=A0AAP0DUY5_9MAGN